VGLRAGLDGRKISSLPGFGPGPSSPYSVAIPTELPGPHVRKYLSEFKSCVVQYVAGCKSLLEEHCHIA